MAASNASYGFVGGRADLLPFSVVSPDVELQQSFRFEICLVSARFKILSSSAASSRPSAAAPPCPPSAAHAAAHGSVVSTDAVPSSSPGQAASTKTKNNKPVDTSVYAWALLSKKGTVFKSEVPGKTAQAEITVSPDSAVADEVRWQQRTCVAVFENVKLKQAKRALASADDRKWQQHDVGISVFRAKKTKDENQPFIKTSTKELGCVAVNLADFIGADQHEQELCSPDGTFALTFQIKTSAVMRAEPMGAPHADVRAARSREEMVLSAAKSQLGNAQVGRDLLIKVDADCAFTEGSHIGIAVEDAWQGKDFMLLHRLSKFEACDPCADNYFGKVAHVDAEASFTAMRIRCPVIFKTKDGKTHQECRFGWRLLSSCSVELVRGVDTHAGLDPRTDVICCIFRSGEAAAADDAAAQQDQKKMQADAILRAKAEQFEQFLDIKKQALLLSSRDFLINSDELGMVRLRQGFLASQPFISAVLERLMRRDDWYGTSFSAACIRFFRSSSGPWDIFSMFNFLMRSRTPNKPDSKDIFGMTAEAIGPKGDIAEKDKFRERLQMLFNNIFCVRNWWAHLGAGSLDCNRALIAVRDFVEILARSDLIGAGSGVCIDATDGRHRPLDRSDTSVSLQSTSTALTFNHPKLLLDTLNAILDTSQGTRFTIDDVAYALFLRTSRQMCKFCTEVYSTLRCSQFSEAMRVKLQNKSSKTSRRQSEFIEVGDVSAVLRKLFNSDALVSFDCGIITSTRNSLSHASENRNQIILVLMALGAIARVASFVVSRCLDPSSLPQSASVADAERARLLQQQGRELTNYVTLGQAELLARCEFLDIGELIGCIEEHHKPAIERCEFFKLISASGQTKSATFRAVKFLLDRQMRGVGECSHIEDLLSCAHGDSEEKKSVKKSVKGLLYLIARIPPDCRESIHSAIAWLVKTEVADAGLLQSSGLRLLIDDYDYKATDDDDRKKTKKEKKGFLYTSAQASSPGYVKFMQRIYAFEEALSKAIESKRDYQVECLSSEKHRAMEEVFSETHPKSSNLNLQQEIELWNERVRFLSEAEAVSACDMARNVLKTLQTQEEKSNELVLGAPALDEVKSFLQRWVQTSPCSVVV
jgi:hypothetical protein